MTNVPPTFVDGIGPPLEQLAEDYAGGPFAEDFFALVGEIKRLHQSRSSIIDALDKAVDALDVATDALAAGIPQRAILTAKLHAATSDLKNTVSAALSTL